MLDQWKREKMYPVGFDTETTGLFAPKWRTIEGEYQRLPEDSRFCYPYLLTFVSYTDVFSADPSFTRTEQGYEWVYTFRVDPKTRLMCEFNDDEMSSLDQICSLLLAQDLLFVGHNAKFDLRMIMSLLSLSPAPEHRLDLNRELISHLLKEQIDDTAIIYHAVDSSQNLELKPLALKWADIPDEDESALKERVDQLRMSVAGNPNYRIATLESFPYLTKGPKRGWYILDTWLPFALGDALGKDMAIRYCTIDSWRTLILHEQGLRRLVADEMIDQYDLNRQSLYPTYWIEDEGYSIHVPSLISKREEIIAAKKTAEKAIIAVNKEVTSSAAPINKRDYARIAAAKAEKVINLNSDDQLADLIHNKLGTPVKYRTEGGKPSVKIAYLLEYFLSPTTPDKAKEVIGHFIAYTKYEKVLQYLKSYNRRLVQGRLYPSYNVTGTGSLRLSSSDPNGQNIATGGLAGKDDETTNALQKLITHDVSIRSIFKPEEGYEWVSVDYAQLQLGIFAFLVGDEAMKQAVVRGDDFHSFMASTIFGLAKGEKPSKAQRRVAKAVNFGYIFGAGTSKIEATAGFKGLFELLKAIFPKAHQFIMNNKNLVEQVGYVLTANNYKLRVPPTKPHAATNYRIQGTEGELVKMALVACALHLEEIGIGKIVCTVHDEIVFAFKKGEHTSVMPTILNLMSSVGQNLASVSIPLTTDAKLISYGDSWAGGVPLEV